MVPVWFVLYWFQRMLAERWAYNWSGAEYGKVSCAGAWVYVFKMWGLSLFHGSNTIWRKHTGPIKGKIGDIKVLPGYAVFKWREDGEPEQYANDGLDDFYHMGCAIGPTPEYPEGAVIEAKGTKWGMVMSSINEWSHAAEMAKVDYTATRKPEDTMAVVTASSYSTVNMRKSPSESAGIVKRVPIGDVVTVLDVADGWAKITHGSNMGYMLERFLDIQYPAVVDDTVVPNAPDYDGDGHIVTVSIPEIEHVAALLADRQTALLEAERQLAQTQEIILSWAGIYG